MSHGTYPEKDIKAPPHILEMIDGIKWLDYGVICECDDFFMCKHRLDFIKEKLI